MVSGLANSAEFKIELGEYLVTPGLVAVLIVGLLFTVPLLGSTVWGAKRIRL